MRRRFPSPAVAMAVGRMPPVVPMMVGRMPPMVVPVAAASMAVLLAAATVTTRVRAVVVMTAPPPVALPAASAVAAAVHAVQTRPRFLSLERARLLRAPTLAPLLLFPMVLLRVGGTGVAARAAEALLLPQLRHLHQR